MTDSGKQGIPVIDLFAGPGGLGEGFAMMNGQKRKSIFEIRLSVEKDVSAWETLTVRNFYRYFVYNNRNVPAAYYKFLAGKMSGESLYAKYPEAYEYAAEVSWHAELGRIDMKEVDRRIRRALGNHRHWLLLGGPPCQAYSIVGRSRNKGNKNYKPEEDHRTLLYKEYLKIIVQYWPAVFVMENVKGILSSEMGKELIFPQITADLENPAGTGKTDGRKKYRYRLYSFADSGTPSSCSSFIIRSEDYGIPQARHRVIILGVREDIEVIPEALRKRQEQIPAGRVLADLPVLRSGLSKEPDTDCRWKARISEILQYNFMQENSFSGHAAMIRSILKQIENRQFQRASNGELPGECNYLGKWYHDKKLRNVCNHETRGHIYPDLHRYLFSAVSADLDSGMKSPTLDKFPEELLPSHRNARSLSFDDRFKVQVKSRPATTITCHLSKDGHYYIHYDPVQCRSLTVREAARLQTFPDNYFFCGSRTAQYRQVGNAVPPYLAKQMAQIVYKIFREQFNRG